MERGQGAVQPQRWSLNTTTTVTTTYHYHYTTTHVHVRTVDVVTVTEEPTQSVELDDAITRL